MTDIGTDEAVTSYLASVRGALADLPAAEVEEILDDVGPHVAEVAQELGPDDLPGKLRERLGEPELYAAELRAAGGYPPRPAEQAPDAPRPSMAGARIGLWLLVTATALTPVLTVYNHPLASPTALVVPLALAALSLVIVLNSPGRLAAVAELPEVRWLVARRPGGPVGEYARLLQPGWWLVRGGLAAMLLVLPFGFAPAWPLVLIVAVPAILGSIWVGRRSQTDRRWLWVVLPLNAFAVVVMLFVLDRGLLGSVMRTGDGFGGPLPTTPSWHGSDVGNIYPFDANGKPLTGVYLYDENGQPITANYSLTECTPTGSVPVPANRFPQPVYEYDANGRCVLRPSSVPSPTELTPADAAPASTPASTPGSTSAPTPTG